MLKWITRQLIPVIRFLGRLHAPWVMKGLVEDDFEMIEMLIRPGDVVLSRTHGFVSNLLIPGYWKHVGIMGEYDAVIEAIGKGVVDTDLAPFVYTKDELLILRPVFCDEQGAREAARVAEGYVGCKYDYAFSLGNKAFYCAELVYTAYSVAMKTMRAVFGFGPRERLGVLTVTADDFSEAHKWWAVIFDSRSFHG